ncbi:MAG: autotransporter outer membrane beta-barrel domain-containing protein [Schwartzia sp.]|nr:autotransporter outer membrane beta-barrel domain-containing protein [Schwartzia sp. (in: firmicutes)]
MKRNRNERRLTKLILCALLTGLVMTPATTGATGSNIGERGKENCKYEWWGVSRPDINPNGNYAYYVEEEPYNHANPENDPNNPKIKDVMGWHNTNNNEPGYDTSANSHMVTVGGNLDLRNVYGGYSTNGNACNNVAIVNSGEISGNLTGGYAHSTATADGNKVFIYGGNFTGDVEKMAVSGGQGKFANGNMVIVYGGTFVHEINGAIVMDHGGIATNNKVVIAGNFSGTPRIYGGNVGDSTYKNVNIVAGNTLYLSGANTASKVQNFETIHIGKIINDQGNPVNVTVKWGTPVLKLTGTGLEENKTTVAALKKAKIDASTLTFTDPENAANGATMNLIACTGTGTINATLVKDTTAVQEYTVSPVTGVTINAALQGSLALTEKAVTYTATENNANKLTFGDVEWKDSGALLDHNAALAGVSFAGAAVDTSNIRFTNVQSINASNKMTLVKDFLKDNESYTGTITGAKYKVGTTVEGDGIASLTDADGDNKADDLVFTALTGAVQEQTHNTVMDAEVGMAALSSGNDFISAATEGLSLAANTGADGVASFAQMGGGSMRQETGSHVDTHTWNAILALGHQNKKERGTFEYGAFFEYGTGNYSTFNGDERGDGNMHYTGGGLLAKYTTKNSVYVEGSLRAGSVHDDARNVLRDFRGMPYSYETNAPYMGFHLGVGKEIAVAGGNTVDVYGKYFYNRRNSVSFDAGGHYDLDAVTSQVIRVGARYNIKRDKWNFYAGAAYEHEFDGKAGGTADGVAIRGADTSGGSVRGEIGATMTPGENSPWSLDLNVSGFAGKKQGFTGGVSVAFMF